MAVNYSSRFTPELINYYIKQGFWDSKLVADHVGENAKNYPGKEAIIDSRARLTWADVNQKSDQIALGLLELGFKKDDVILEQLPNFVELYLVLLAGEKAGITIVTCQPTFRHYEISAIAQHVKAKGIVIPLSYRDFNYFDMVTEIRPKLPELKHIIVTGNEIPAEAVSFNGILQQKLQDKYPQDYLKGTRFKPYEIVRVNTTSGTTGIPKCAVWETSILKSAGKILARRWELNSQDILGAFYNIVGGGLSIASFYSVPQVAAKLVMLERFTPEGFCELVQREKITVATIVPTEMARLLDYPEIDKYDLSSLRLLVHSTTFLPRELAIRAEKKLRCKYVQTYGSADCTAIACNTVNDPLDVRIGTVGRPYDGNEVKIVDEKGNPVPQGEFGEILTRGPNNNSGYYNYKEMNEKCWQGGWFDTSNEGAFDKDGNIIILGRRRDVIKRGGQAIYPKEIEDLLAAHPKISEVAIVRMPDKEMGEKVCAFIVPRRDATITFDEVIAFLKAKKLAPFKLPERVEVRRELPLAAGQKVSILALEGEVAQILEREGRSKN